jgi:hypothetical protein
VIVLFLTITTGIALSLPKQCHCPTLNLDSSVHVEPETSHLTYTAGEHVSIYCSDSKYLTPTGLPPIVTVCQDNCTWSQDVSHIQCIGERTVLSFTVSSMTASLIKPCRVW